MLLHTSEVSSDGSNELVTGNRLDLAAIRTGYAYNTSLRMGKYAIGDDYDCFNQTSIFRLRMLAIIEEFPEVLEGLIKIDNLSLISALGRIQNGNEKIMEIGKLVEGIENTATMILFRNTIEARSYITGIGTSDGFIQEIQKVLQACGIEDQSMSDAL